MIRGITVSRTNVAPAVCDPVQWSSNSQLAINNSQSLTILEPTLPSLHQSIIPSPRDSSKPVLDSKSLFDIKNVIHADIISSWELRKFYNVEVTTCDEALSFGKFADPLIVSHKWTPASPYTKNSDIAVLLNTSELLVLERSSAKSDSYSIKYNVFDVLLEGLELTTANVTDKGEIRVTNEQFLSLKVLNFEYTSGPAANYVAVALANNTISVYSEDFRLLQAGIRIPGQETSDQIVKLQWSPWTNGVSYISVVTASNSIHLVEVEEAEAGSLRVAEASVSVQPSSRFLVSQVEWSSKGSYLFIGSTNEFKTYNVQTKFLSKITLEATNFQLMTGIIAQPEPEASGSISIHLSFEYGAFAHLSVDLEKNVILQGAAEAGSSFKQGVVLDNLVKSKLYKYQLSSSVTVGESAPSNHNYLNDTVEGLYINYGTKSNGHVIAVVSRIVPKKVINYTILSKIEYQIDFIPVSSLNGATLTVRELLAVPSGSNSVLSWLNSYWFNHFESDIPQIKQVDESNAIKLVDDIKVFLNKFVQEEVSADPKKRARLAPVGSKFPSLKESILQNFINDTEVFKLQLQFNILTILQKTLKVLLQSTSSDVLRAPLVEYESGLKNIEVAISERIRDIISSLSTQAEQPIDKFIETEYLWCLQNEDGSGMEVDYDAPAVEFTNQFLTESFKPQGGSRSEIASLSNHKWKRCNLTLLPLLQLNHKTSEIGGYDFIVHDFDEDSWLGQGLLTYLDYCIYSGNRTFKKK